VRAKLTLGAFEVGLVASGLSLSDKLVPIEAASPKRRQTGKGENVVTDYPDISDGHQVSVSGSTSAIK